MDKQHDPEEARISLTFYSENAITKVHIPGWSAAVHRSRLTEEGCSSFNVFEEAHKLAYSQTIEKRITNLAWLVNLMIFLVFLS